jgi:hypothetical protein
MGRYAYNQRRARRRQPGCLSALLALIFLGSLALLVYALAGRPTVSRAVADGIVGAPVPTLIPQGETQAQVVEQAGAVLPTAVAALPPGALVVRDADINGFLAAQPAAIAPLEQVSVQFTGGLARAQVRAYGLSSVATVGLAAEGGRVVVTEAAVGAPLSYVLSGPELAATLAERLNAELAAQGRSVDELRIEEGQIVLVTR